MRLFPSLLAAALALTGCVSVHSRPLVSRADAGPSAALGTGLVSAADPRAADAGAAMLRQGGSAADAAIATLLALNVVEPESSGIGGGGFLVYRDAKGAVQTYDGREEAPHAAGGDWFFANGQPLSIEQAIPGGRSVGVPGNIRLIYKASHDHGRLPWKALFQPAIALARDGFVMTPRLHNSLDAYRETGALSAEARALYYGSDGHPLSIGTRIRNPALADFLTMIAERGPDSFYVGPNANAIAATVSHARRNPAPLSIGDLASYEAKRRPPVCGIYRAYRICGMGPPTSGGTAVYATLKMLERFDLSTLGPNSPVAWHLIAESMRLAYADRDRYLADADYIPVPVAGLMDPAYLAARSALISPDRTIANVTAGAPRGATAVRPGLQPAEHGTSHLVNGYYLNNELTDFSLVPNVNGVPVANRVAGGKRPRSSMAPTIVFGSDGHVRLAIGAAGGATIPAQVIKAIIAVLDWHLAAQQAIALPVLYAPSGPTVYVEKGSSLEAMIPALVALGHSDVRAREPSFKANAIEWVDCHWAGAADPRSEGAAVTP
ncbi:MAG: gamma-glutamyltransferase family protein [Sphingomonadales bacterium]|nr:gamma-glutamyltransferase family protein [Sphingomonadales bacterium]